ncbi:HTH domain-containing protein [Rhizobium leguminosarum]|uniref:HTH domain-containing protein n=1 Tax=Rhizobium leguminosarum TaxID=384 RepID=UPI000369D791|nr:HTH domain-containing protein [Rhizobium leguminosarum]
MADAYLNMAESVLRAAKTPLRPAELITFAYANGMLPWHLHGLRQDKTLHARLSEDIARNRESSVFFRTAPGTFFLREFLAGDAHKKARWTEYLAPPRRKELKRDYILSVDFSEVRSESNGDGIFSATQIWNIVNSGSYKYKPFQEIFSHEDLIAVHSFVVVFQSSNVLSFRTGKFRPSTDPLYGSRSIGVGGAVLAKNLDFLFESMAGIVASGIDELSYGIGLPMRLAERARYENEVKPWFGVLLDRERNRPKVLHVVMGYHCPLEFFPTKAALSINDLRWINVQNPGNTLDHFDPTSREILGNGRLMSFVQGVQIS